MADDLTDTLALLVAVSDTGMRLTGCMQAKEIGIFGEDRPLLGSNVIELNLIRRADQSRIGRGGDIDPAAT